MRYTIDSPPEKIEITTHVEIYSKGNVITLYYKGTPDAMYKYSGAVFGISARRGIAALNSGDAVIYSPHLFSPY